MIEQATERLFVRASPEIVAELLRGESRQVNLSGRRVGDELELVIREIRCVFCLRNDINLTRVDTGGGGHAWMCRRHAKHGPTA